MHAKLDYVFEFLEDLSRHNTREWMHTRVNERRFDVVQRTLRQWIAMLMLDMQDIEDTHGLKPKESMYRIWRDTRFSDNKTPCKTYLSFLIRKGGRRNEDRAAYYVQIGPNGQSFIGGGVYMPDSPRLRKIREAIVRDGEMLRRIVTERSFIKMFGGLEPLKLKTRPRDFRTEEISDEVRELLRYTSFVATLEVPDAEVLSRGFDARVLEVFTVLKPLNTWLSDALAR
jgi:uncharacterized protein (TIGR02453 family)